MKQYFCDQQELKKQSLKQNQAEKKKVDVLQAEIEKALNEKLSALTKEIQNYNAKSEKLKIDKSKCDDFQKKLEREK